MEPALERRLSEMMRRAQDGDRRAYAELLTEIAPLLGGFVHARTARADWVDDIVQETLISLHRSRHAYDPVRPFLPWLYAIASHRLVDFARKQRRHETGAREEAEERGGAPDPAERAGELLEALEALPPRQREIIRMLKSDGYSVAEVAERTGLSPSHVKVTAHRGYQKLRFLLQRGAHED